MKTKAIVTIKEINISGKWVDFWFEEGRFDSENGTSFDQCCKRYMFDDIIKPELLSEIYTNGLKGYKMEWKRSKEMGNQWVPVRLFKARKSSKQLK